LLELRCLQRRRSLADNAATERLLVLGTLRREGAALDLVDALDRSGSASFRTLEPLGRAETGEMVVACLAEQKRPVSGAVTGLIDSRAERLPFLVEELLAGLSTRGSLVASEAGWELSSDLDPVDVPLSFAQTVRERMGELPEDERRVLGHAAILGRDFDWSYLPSIVLDSESDVLDALSRAVDLQLVEEVAGGRFSFRHALTLDAIVAEMLGPERARLAARALDNLLPAPGRVAPELLEVAAHRASQAGRAAAASRYLTAEARRSLESVALAAAIATARRARSLARADQPELLTAGELLVSALSAAGHSAAVEDVGPELLTALEARSASPERRRRSGCSLPNPRTPGCILTAPDSNARVRWRWIPPMNAGGSSSISCSRRSRSANISPPPLWPARRRSSPTRTPRDLMTRPATRLS
jgi:predicted ATPase